MREWTDFYGAQVELKDFLHELESHTELFSSIMEEKPVKILEVGVGSGRMSIFLSWLGFDVIGMDNNPKIVKIATQTKKNLNGSASFQAADAFNLPYKNNTIDCVFSQGFFEHFHDDEIIHLLNEELRVAKTVIFSVPNNYYKKKDFGNERLLSKERWDNL